MAGCLFGVAASVLDSLYCVVEIENIIIGVDLEEETRHKPSVEGAVACVRKVGRLLEGVLNWVSDNEPIGNPVGALLEMTVIREIKWMWLELRV